VWTAAMAAATPVPEQKYRKVNPVHAKLKLHDHELDSSTLNVAQVYIQVQIWRAL